MSRKPYPSDVSDEEWSFVAPYLILMDQDAPQRQHDLREVFNALRWLVRAGAPWRMLPNDLPPWEAVYQQSRRWLDAGCFEAIVSDLRSIIRVAQGYDAQGQRISTTDAAGHSTLYQYDALGRLTQTTDALGGTTKQSWDAHEQLTSLTDAKGNTHKFDYDKAGQLIRETRPLGGAIQYAYDQAGNLTQRTDAGGNTRSYSYDAASRMTQEEHKLDGTSADQKISYQYDKDGQLKGYEQTDGQGQLISQASYQRDAQGRVATSDHTYGKADGTTFSFQIGQSFNADGQLASHQYPDGSTQSYSYGAGRLSKVTLPNGSEIGYQNYQWMVPQQITTPGATKTQTFDALQRPISIEVRSQTSNSQGNQTAQRLMSRLYQYDQTGNITQIKSDLGTTDYGYDNLSRLTQAKPDDALQALGLPNEQYSYDAVHNRMSSAHQPGAWSYNADNQLTQYPYLKPFSPGSQPVDTTVSYTAQGHTQKESSSQWEKNYQYNAAERLILYSQTDQGQGSPTLEASYRYDPFGRRITKTITQGSTTTTTYFVYGEQGLMAEANEAGKLIKAYGFNPIAAQQGLWSTDPIWQAEVSNASLTATDTSYHYLHTDHLGTPQLATTKDGSASWKAAAEAFGAAGIIQSQSTIEMNLRFPGQYFDQETNSHYNFHRDYKPNLGRYLQSDPIGLMGGENLYGYANQSPMIYGDYNGNNPIVLLRFWLILIAKCELVHESYKSLEATCRSCRDEKCTPEDAAANCACWAGVVQLRKNYLRMHCDYILPGSIARGSKKAEAGHRNELRSKIVARNICCAKAAISIVD